MTDHVNDVIEALRDRAVAAVAVCALVVAITAVVMVAFERDARRDARISDNAASTRTATVTQLRQCARSASANDDLLTARPGTFPTVTRRQFRQRAAANRRCANAKARRLGQRPPFRRKQ